MNWHAIGYVLLGLSVIGDIVATKLLCNRNYKQGHQDGFDRAVLMQRAGLHPILHRERTK